ncbi:hypothetical protein VB711_17215 [Cronbergia sp. UHCC 0137]|uniref:hypothetical protein n=1 Tax=Cronbergia sp. UHCC 0137 TaxID=3110239 RepID=UPI002B1EB096|nr:hypothetical protein [Cronbergia sp. UHCC 0137]MEA5619566.1 hypothetical protein [Cronbergia sp. UHCC 0137]
MKPIQQTHRHVSAQKFQQSLYQLKDILQTTPAENEVIPEASSSSPIDDTSSNNPEISYLEALEDAVADIEQYLAEKNNQ